MCNDYRLKQDPGAYPFAFSQLKLPLRFPQGVPNFEPREDIRITETAPIIRAAAEGDGAELVQLRWSWKGPAGKPVFNFRSEGRRFRSGRCLIPADGFYEFTDPPEGSPKGARKQKWLFTLTGEPWFCIAGYSPPDHPEAFTMLTSEPGPDIAPLHARQVVVLRQQDWPRWLDPSVPEAELLRPLPEGSLERKLVAV